jgi:hypothetical protein
MHDNGAMTVRGRTGIVGLPAGHDWLFVLSGRLELILAERRAMVNTGEAAEFSTMTPHAINAIDKPAEFIMVFDRDGKRAHLHNSDA